MTQEPTTDIERWADRAQFHAESFEQLDELLETMGVIPKVSLVWMTPDPLGALASFCEMYKGNVIRSMADVTDEMRRGALSDVLATHLQAPLENIKVQFLLEGVDRAFTHQLVRQRTAVFAQESMRFAVPGDLWRATSLPPHLMGTKKQVQSGDVLDLSFNQMMETLVYLSDQQKERAAWDYGIEIIDHIYHYLVNRAMPSEEARGLMPHAVATRVQFTTDMRNLIAHAGNRLCTQAQFHWRSVFYQMVEQIRSRSYDTDVAPGEDWLPLDHPEAWQYEAIANSGMFKPVCFQVGKCPFKASFDRACSIRDRVDHFSSLGLEPSKWEDSDEAERHGSNPIRTEEWLVDPTAARVRGE